MQGVTEPDPWVGFGVSSPTLHSLSITSGCAPRSVDLVVVRGVPHMQALRRVDRQLESRLVSGHGHGGAILKYRMWKQSINSKL